ncbi:MAG: hypothetical protein HF314_07270 [Ignavibacteria bacterium]|jgi:hypothetical protein|nr:hypothetical protein [Ignavibacteria bacterium]MCU7502855.1 hypothetical protein [Ignavibacteria bacterium]MCU7515651.1 hypothetical protein [Ignavibacteria bacterium]
MFENLSYKMHEENIKRISKSTDLDELKDTYFNNDYLASWVINLFLTSRLSLC